MVDIVVVSSSPTRTFHTSTVNNMIPSSPDLPTLESIVRAKTAIQSGSHAAPPPKDATPGFASASILLTTSDACLSRTRQIEGPETVSGGEGTIAISTKKTSKATTSTTLVENGVAKKPRKPRAKTLDGAAKSADVKEKTVRKSRAKKPVEEGQSKMPKAKITKSIPSQPREKRTTKPKLQRTQKSSHHFLYTEAGLSPADPFQVVDDEVSTISVATTRRTAWTPPPTTAPTENNFVTPHTLQTNVSHTDDSTSVKKINFKDLVGQFGLAKEEGSSKSKEVMDAVSVKKRKLIELIRTNSLETIEAPPRPKAVKKKPRTVTEAATSIYRQEDGHEPAPLLKYISRDSMVSKLPVDFNKSGIAQSKSPIKRGDGIKFRQEISLLSPQSAVKRANQQDFVFGTSSQLARDESPEFLKDLHAVMRASNSLDLDTTFDSVLGRTTQSLNSSSVSVSKPLWTAGARGVDGKLLDIETVDLTTTPAPAQSTITRAALPPNVDDSVILSPPEIEHVKSLSLDVRSKATGVASELPTLRAIGPVEAAIRETLLSSPGSTGGRAERTVPRRNATGKPVATINPVSNKPEYNSLSNVQLAKEIKKYHFKAVKTRDGMIALLEKCWEAKHRRALGVLGANAIMQTSPIRSPQATQRAVYSTEASPKRSRGRPRKHAVSPSNALKEPKRQFEVQSDSDTPLTLRQATKKKPGKNQNDLPEEISDSDAPFTPSPPRRHASLIGTPPLPLQLTIADDVLTSPVLSPTSQQASLQRHITRAIKNCPRSADPNEPSWHEKILLYDPIVLEDLAIWLNTGALEKVGWDGEVTPLEVKKWCTEKSVCCLWRENLRGGSRARY